MMRFLGWLVAGPFALLGLVFALSNRDEVAVRFWPFDAQVGLPLSLLVLGLLIVGLGVGLALGWVARMGLRVEARRLRKALAALEEENRVLTAPKQAEPERARSYGRLSLFSRQRYLS